MTGGLHGRNPARELRPRLLAALWLIVAVFLLLAVRLYALQIVRGEELSRKGRENFLQQLRVPHDRGIIFDRFGRILADNRPSLDLQVTPAFLGDKTTRAETLRALGRSIGLSAEEQSAIEEGVAAQRGLDRFQPLTSKRDLTAEQVEAIEAERSLFRLDGVTIVEGRRRAYPHGKLAAHLLGYVKEIDGPQLETERGRGNPRRYVLGDFMGRDGVEWELEGELRGQDGVEKTVVDAKGRRQHADAIEQLLGENRRQAPQPGRNVFLTIDRDLQQAAEAAFDGTAGAVVAVDPRNGEVLALVSVPAFDPGAVSGLLGLAEKERLDNDPLKPWMNRAISGQYAPGSTFKAFTAEAALREKATSPSEKVRCPGYFAMGRTVWRCHKDSGHGLVDLTAALKVSCDTYFYTMGARIGIDPLAAVARAFGFGARSGIALRNEKPGLVPDEAFHDRVDKATGGYQRGMVVNTAIGQGSLLVTPLQLAFGYAALANGGVVWRPLTVDRIETADFRVTRRFLAQARDAAQPPAVAEEVIGDPPAVLKTATPTPTRELGLDGEQLAAVRAGLFAVTNEAGGTAYWRRSRKVSMSGKTGTAQVVRLGRERLKNEEMSYWERDHAWFVAWAPAEAPELVVAVVNEHSGHGSSAAAPIAVRVIDAWFDLGQARLARAPAAADEGAR